VRSTAVMTDSFARLLTWKFDIALVVVKIPYDGRARTTRLLDLR
jgi:hypothetical protein